MFSQLRSRLTRFRHVTLSSLSLLRTQRDYCHKPPTESHCCRGSKLYSMQASWHHRSHCCQSHARSRLEHARLAVRAPVAASDAPSTSGRLLDYAPTSEPVSPGFLNPELPPVDPWIRPQPQTYTQPSVRDSGTLRPAAEWYPAWMKYRRREDNYVFWQDKFTRCSLEIPRELLLLSAREQHPWQ